MSIDQGTTVQGDRLKKKRIRGWPTGGIAPLKRRLGKLLSQIEDGTIDAKRARLLIQGAATVLSAIKTEKLLDIEERLEKLEKSMGRK